MSDTHKAPDAPPGTTREEAETRLQDDAAPPKPTAEQMREAMEREGGNMTRDD